MRSARVRDTWITSLPRKGILKCHVFHSCLPAPVSTLVNYPSQNPLFLLALPISCRTNQWPLAHTPAEFFSDCLPLQLRCGCSVGSTLQETSPATVLGPDALELEEVEAGPLSLTDSASVTGSISLRHLRRSDVLVPLRTLPYAHPGDGIGKDLIR
ncbi:hypothetical protein OBBRIDRAFT_204739 [Obba rivulosa]|uniref:Uncharacterized protein n=1 Tax=Obba rivulosa TaxID=1052685 RepID=A0A8E2ARH0_9APHY|nr:hypothetical protein OBBRIDRAFT_204739 [Obba rivulosa]